MPDLPEDVTQFAQEFQDAAQGGGFNPFSLLTGAQAFHSVFLAPFTPQMQAAVDEFLATRAGPLAYLVDQFQQQGGLSPAEAAERVGLMLRASGGMLVVVQADDQGITTIPQLFFGHLDEPVIKQAVDTCGPDWPHKDDLRAALLGLRRVLERGQPAPTALFATVDGRDDAREYWLDLAEHFLGGLDEGIFPGMSERQRDLAYWLSSALATLRLQGVELDGDELYAAARCQLLAGAVDGAMGATAELVSDYDVEDERLLVLLEHLVGVAIREGQPERAVTFLAEQAAAIDQVLGGLYELALVRFKAHAAAQADGATLVAAAAALKKADRKSFRHDLNREPLWQVTVKEPGELLAVEDVADRIERSVNFVAKRVESRTIPVVVDGDEVRIPAAGLAAWQAVVAEFGLLD